jgi:hypothetical protein
MFRDNQLDTATPVLESLPELAPADVPDVGTEPAAVRPRAAFAGSGLATNMSHSRLLPDQPGHLMPEAEYQPGEPAPIRGVFREVNVFGTPTGLTAQVEAGDPLPGAPVGFRWCWPIPRRTLRKRELTDPFS